ncbi:MAG: DUF2891 domain-containing protein [Sphingomicrobium sp.]
MAGIALGHVTREYPHKLDHVWGSDADSTTPRQQHPIFFGSFDWHSCVHGWWTLLTLRRMFPGMDAAGTIDALANASFTPDKVAAELAYLERPLSAGFERPYGWGWLLALHQEEPRLESLAMAIAERFKTYLAKLTYPIRTGTHANTSFALILALDWAETRDPQLATTIRAWASDKFAADRDCQAWEPGGDEFLSSALTEALLMRRCLGDAAFADWFAAFLPRIATRDPATLFIPATVSDRSDGKIAHLDGLNLSRAWCWRGIAAALLPAERAVALAAADEHLSTALPHIAGDYMGEHWLASFALLALTV